MRLLPYFVARSAAHEMDRYGPPGRVLQAVVLVPLAVCVIGILGCVAFFVVSFTAWKLGIG